MLRKVQIVKRTFSTPNLPIVHTKYRLNSIRLFSKASRKDHSNQLEYTRHRKVYRTLSPLDPFKIGEERVERNEVTIDWDPRLTLTVRNAFERFSLSPEHIEINPLGYSEERFLELVRVVEEFSEKLTMLDRSELLRVLLLKYSSIKLDTSQLKLTVQTLVESGLDPAFMLDRQPTMLCLDLTHFMENAEIFLEIVGPKWEELTFETVVLQELKNLSSFAARNQKAESGAQLVRRMYNSEDNNFDQQEEKLSEYRIYIRIFNSIKRTVVEREQPDTAVYRECEEVYARLRRAVVTDLCSKHFKEVVLGMSPEFVSGIRKFKGVGLENTIWVDSFLRRISARKILIKVDDQITELTRSHIKLLDEYEIDLNDMNLVMKCPELLNVQVDDIKKSIEILHSAPFYFNRNDISMTFYRDPRIFLDPAVLRSTRRQLVQIPMLMKRQIPWYLLVKRTPSVLTLRNYAKVFKILEEHGFSEGETLTVFLCIPSLLRKIERTNEKLERNSITSTPYITKIGFSQYLKILKKRIEEISDQAGQVSHKDETISPDGDIISELELDGVEWDLESEDKEEFDFEMDTTDNTEDIEIDSD